METWDDDCDDDDIYNSGRFIILLLTVEEKAFLFIDLAHGLREIFVVLLNKS